MDTITDPDSGITTYNHDLSGHHDWVTSIDYPNGARSVMAHDVDGRTTHVTNTERVGGPGNGGVMLDLTYKFGTGDNKSVRTEVISPSDSTVYGYDELNRLTSATTTLNGGGTTSSYTYSYDGAGNRKTSKVGPITATFSYNNADQLTTAGVVHDANGNMTAGGNHGYTAQVFNELDQATSVTPKGQAARAQTYGGQLQSTWLSDATTRFGTAGSVGITAMSDGTTTTSFVRDPSGRLVSMKRGADRSYYHYDGRGSIDSLTDSDGNQVQRYRYEPYGRLATGTIGTIDQPFRWNAEYAINDYDYKIGARRYDASIARWTQTDPSGQDANNYAYAGNDPINSADPSGLCVAGIFGECDNPVNSALTSIDDIDPGKAKDYALFTGAVVGSGIAAASCVTATAGFCALGVGVAGLGLAGATYDLFDGYRN